MINYDLINHYIDQKNNGRSYSEIRKELSNEGYTPEEISDLIHDIDEEILQKQHIKTKKKYGQVLYLLGIALITYGIVVELFSVYSYIENQKPLIIVLLPFLIGITLIQIGRNRKRALNRAKGIRRFRKRY